MTRISSCLSADELRRFLLGEVAEVEAERLEQHLLSRSAEII